MGTVRHGEHEARVRTTRHPHRQPLPARGGGQGQDVRRGLDAPPRAQRRHAPRHHPVPAPPHPGAPPARQGARQARRDILRHREVPQGQLRRRRRRSPARRHAAVPHRRQVQGRPRHDGDGGRRDARRGALRRAAHELQHQHLDRRAPPHQPRPPPRRRGGAGAATPSARRRPRRPRRPGGDGHPAALRQGDPAAPPAGPDAAAPRAAELRRAQRGLRRRRARVRGARGPHDGEPAAAPQRAAAGVPGPRRVRPGQVRRREGGGCRRAGVHGVRRRAARVRGRGVRVHADQGDMEPPAAQLRAAAGVAVPGDGLDRRHAGAQGEGHGHLQKEETYLVIIS